MAIARSPFTFMVLLLFSTSSVSADELAEPSLITAAKSEKFELRETENVTISITPERISPQKLDVKPGTTLIWVNRSESNVQISFLGKAVSTTCKAPRRFVLGKQGIYRSEVLPRNQVASICIIEPDDYSYRVEYFSDLPTENNTAKSEVKGELLVRSR